ncbi:MAG: hypothetical protein QHH30_06735, partial [candidate division NC10 bacterium]|nr:hypothetical protein [candidate division NC10 bacterium]
MGMAKGRTGNLQRELTQIRTQVGLLQQQVEEIRAKLEGAFVPIEEVLRRRGLTFRKASPTDNLLLPAGLPPIQERRFYEMMKRYSFRIFLRELIARRGSRPPSRLRRFCSPETEEEYLNFLVGCGILKEKEQGHALAKETVRNFGGTLEWFLAQVMEREFACPAIYGVKFDHLSAGGDYDVLSWVERNLLYLEVKSSPPKHIEAPEVRSFLERIEALRPNLSILLVDTELRMKDKMVKLFEEQLAGAGGKVAGSIRRLFDETFLIKEAIFLTNSKPNLISNLARIFRYFLGQREDR